MELLRRSGMSLVAWVLVMSLQVVYAEYTSDEIVDLSIPYKSNDTLTFPSFPYPYQSEVMFDTNFTGGTIEAYSFKMPVHSGTHLDAPCHVTSVPNNLRMNQVPISRFFGPAAIIDISSKANEKRDYLMSMQDVRAWEEKNGKIPDGAIVLVLTGWSKKYADDPDNYFGGKNASGDYQWLFPGVAAGVGTFLVDERNINAIGIDTANPDNGLQVALTTLPVHLEILDKKRLIIENIGSNLDKLPPRGYRIHAVPLALHNTCGAPIRLLALKEPEESAGAAVSVHQITAALFMSAFLFGV